VRENTEQCGECNTLLPELAATEVVKCVQYMRMDIELFEELLSMVEPLIYRKSTKFRYSELNLYYKYEKNIIGLVVSCRFPIPLHGPTDFV